MKYFLIFVAILFSITSSHSQDKKAMKYVRTITTDDLYEYLSILASDSLEGRETGERGQKMAASYIENKFKSFGLEAPVEGPNGKSYVQEFPLKKMSYLQTYLKKGDEKKVNYQDFLFYSRAETVGEEYIDVVYSRNMTLGKLKSMDLAGKYVCFSNEENADYRTIVAELKKLDAAGVFIVEEDARVFKFIMSLVSNTLKGTKLTLEVDNKVNKILFINPELVEWMYEVDYQKLKKSGDGKSCRIIFNSDYLVEDVYAENILGYIPGEEKPEEVVVVTSHYDHIGILPNGEINNGADDDGSGTSAVLEIAQAFSKAAADGNRPKRSILFMTVSGEEKGLLGSEYYSKHPVFPLDNTVTDLNIDMVGRVDPKHEGQADYIYVIGADKLSEELHDLSETVNKTYTKLDFDYTYNADNDPNRFYYRSDHYNFAKFGVPVIFYFNGTHADYHKPTDTIEKIDFKLLQKRAQLVFYTAWELANRENRVKLD